MENVTLLSDTELEELETLVGKERLKRKAERESKLWDNVITALRDFTRECGEVAIDAGFAGCIYITSHADYSTVGIIDMNEEE